MLKIFTLKYQEKTESFNDSAMAYFLADKEIIRWESQFFEHKNKYFWTLLLEYRKSIPHIEIWKKESSKDENYKDILTENDRPLFKVLREWRSERCKDEGIPPYIICTNMQLANIAILCQSLPDEEILPATSGRG